MDKFIVFSGIQPSGNLTIGNYIGAIRPWIKLQDKHKSIYCIADLHAITLKSNINDLNKITLDFLAMYIACGIDPNKSIIFVQSNISQHNQLEWILNCYTYFNELIKMNQFKSKKNKLIKCINSGILNYPILMASDILLYQTNYVPVGEDQKQHIELVRRIAKRFNSIYGKIFTIPKALILKNGSKIMSLLNPKKKMSKSDNNLNNTITLLENPKYILKKFKKALTDSDQPPEIKYDPFLKPGISNLLNILSGISEIPISKLELEFSGKTYKYLKYYISDIVSDKLNTLQKKYFYIRKDELYLNKILKEGAKKAQILSKITLNKVYKTLGLYTIKK